MTCPKLKNQIFFYMLTTLALLLGDVKKLKEIKEIKKKLNGDFIIICECFVDNKISIHIGKDKTKSILFASKHKKKFPKLNITYKSIQIKQDSKVTYLGSILDETM